MAGACTVGIAQWLPACNEPEQNLRDALSLIGRLADRGCDLVVLPELWPCGYDPVTLARDAPAAAEPLEGPRGQALSAAAAEAGVWLFAGTVPECDGDRLYNTAVVYGPTGWLAAAHRKVHLYIPLGEEQVFSAGQAPTVVDVDGVGIVGLSICFDGDHPAYARRLHQLGARIVVQPAAYETAAQTWWDVLYPANALVNGQWWVMANQCGGQLLGKSKVIGPDGITVAQAGGVDEADSTELLVVTVDFDAGIAEADQTSAALWTDVAVRGYAAPKST